MSVVIWLEDFPPEVSQSPLIPFAVLWNVQFIGLTHSLLNLFLNIVFLMLLWVELFFSFSYCLLLVYRHTTMNFLWDQLKGKSFWWQCWNNEINIRKRMNLDPFLNIDHIPKVKAPRTALFRRTFCDDGNVLCAVQLVATCHMWLLSSWYVSKLIEKSSFTFFLIQI